MKTIYALRITGVTNALLDSREWQPGRYLRFVRAEEQEPALGFGNFDHFYPCGLYGATFYEGEYVRDQLDRWGRAASSGPVGVEIEAVPFNEGAPIR